MYCLAERHLLLLSWRYLAKIVVLPAMKSTSHTPWTRPLRVHLGLIIVLLLIGVSAPLIWLGFDRARQAALTAIDEQMASLSERIVDHYRVLFSDKLAFVGLVSVLDSFQKPPPDQLDEKVEFLAEAAILAPDLDGLLVGYPDGSFLRAFSLHNDDQSRRFLNAPSAATIALQIIAPDTGGRQMSTWRFLDDNRRIVEIRDPVPEDYDPRLRPWYKAAIAGDGNVVTQAYAMPLMGAKVKTLARRHASDPRVVVAANIRLDTIARFLDGERISPRSTAYVFDTDGSLIIHSDAGMMNVILSNMEKGTNSKDLESRDPLLPMVMRLIGSGMAKGATTLHSGAETYVTLFVPVDFTSVLKGSTIVVAAPQSDFTTETNSLMRQGLATALAVLAIGLAIAIIVSRMIGASLTKLTSQALRLRDLDFGPVEPVRSRITEIGSLAAALASARAAIGTFGLYVPKELVRRIVQSGLRGERSAARQVVTVMFTDIRDFTTLSEHNEPETVVALLSDYFDLMNRGVRESRGTIVQFLGDSVYAMWNAPVANEDHAADACRCALRLKADLDAFNASQRETGAPEFVTRFGLHTGPAVVGNVGAEDRLQYTGMGDTVNVASRLEGLSKQFGTYILTSQQTVDACAGRFVFRPLGPCAVKGRKETLEVFELVDVVD